MTDTIRSQAPAAAPAATDDPRRRSSAIDAVRVLTAATIVLAHASTAHEWVRPWLFTWHVPTFLVISGYLWRPRALGDELGRRTWSLLVPYLSWLLLVTGVWFVVAERRGQPLDHDFLVDVLRGGSYIGLPFSAYWYITALFVACLLARLLDVVCGRWSLLATLGVGAVGIGIGTLDPDLIRAPWLGAGFALPLMFFLGVGRLLKTARPRLAGAGRLSVVLLGAGAALVLAGVRPLDVKAGDFGTPALAVVAGTLVACGLVLGAETLFAGRHVQAISTLATTGIAVILGHSVVLGVLTGTPYDAPAWVIVTAVVLPWLGALVAHRMPLLDVLFLGGWQRASSRPRTARGFASAAAA